MKKNKMKPKERFAVGAKVRIKMPGMNGVVIQLDDNLTILGEYWHTIQTERGELREPGSNLELIPVPKTQSVEPTVPTTVHVYGPNPRVNLNSADNSTNVASLETRQGNNKLRDRQIDALMKLVPQLDEAFSHLRLIVSAGKVQGQPDDPESARRMAICLASASREFIENRLLISKSLESKINEFFNKMTSASIDLGMIFDPMVQDGNLRARWRDSLRNTYKELFSVLEAINDEARAIIHGGSNSAE